MNETLFEVLFMMVILKIPIVYLCAVVWYACKEPPPPEGAARLVRAPEPQPVSPWERYRVRRDRPRGAGPHGGPVRRSRRREALARGRVGL